MDYSPTAQTVVEADSSGLLPGWNDEGGEKIIIVFTIHAGTVTALKRASHLSTNLRTRPQVLMVYEMPYTLPPEERVLPEGFVGNHLRSLKRNSPNAISVRVCLCRHPRLLLRPVLPPRPLTGMGGKKH
jgi:hypothetical protein